ncbi:hypothetical protein IVA80_18590 [Bradyrhizobium sp. 139]|uniref:hypothetical protein n=1 Tax=Bradyrhizobium sp. 139 TaxID=2782616 RepID=UPI001FFABAD9|nr:hypothetical protein [Bradyrhizobium sp. 139]MCK1742829.1 hypothetical protein [Bradyrhizobium sp. 139]
MNRPERAMPATLKTGSVSAADGTAAALDRLEWRQAPVPMSRSPVPNAGAKTSKER